MAREDGEGRDSGDAGEVLENVLFGNLDQNGKAEIDYMDPVGEPGRWRALVLDRHEMP